MSKYSNFSKEELLALVEKQENELASKKYGLVWDSEREPEQVVLDCENNLPVLKRVKGKEIHTNDTEDNILIEGDNYHALTVLNYTHQEKIDVIYIDPPYNTGNQDFKYNDKFVDREDGFRHSKWLNFMEKRLNLAKDLLKETGVIFISIDDNEVAQLKMLCDKVFGQENFITTFIWKTRQASGKQVTTNNTSTEHEYILAYNKKEGRFFVGSNRNRESYTNPDNDIRGDWAKHPLDVGATKTERPNCFYDLIDPETGFKYLANPNRVWAFSKESMSRLIEEKKIIFDPKGKNRPALKKFWLELKSEFKPFSSVLSNIEYDLGYNTEGTKLLNEIFGKKIFDYPKPVSLIKLLAKQTTDKNSVVLDFMAGSGTTGQAVLELNKEDNGNRKFILCTNNELNGFEKELREKGLSEKEIEKYGICQRVTYSRLEKVIKGYKKNGDGEKVEGLSGNLQYFRTALVKKTTTVNTKLDITFKCTEMLCVKENIFNLEKEAEDYKIFSSNKKDKFLCIYYNFIEKSFDNFLSEVKKIKEEKAIYIFSLKDEIDKKITSSVENARFEAIPHKILKVYEEWVKKNIPMRNDLILLEFERAKDKLFEQKDKDESARLLRIVLEKIIIKISQKNNVEFLKENAKQEKASILNDKLKSENIFSKVDWEENKTYLAIGNNASHGDYGDYNIKQVENFYRHIQMLLNKFGI